MVLEHTHLKPFKNRCLFKVKFFSLHSYWCLVFPGCFSCFPFRLLFGYLWNVLFLVMHTFRLSSSPSARTASFWLPGA